MKTIATFTILLGMAASTFGQGYLNFENGSSTLISANGVPMPVSGTQQFFFALFLAPSTTVSAPGQTTTFTDPAFQIVAAYNTNTSIAPGRLTPRPGLVVGQSQGFSVGSTIDFVVRGWSANAGATWSEALANWNNGSPLQPMFIGSSQVGNDLQLVSPTFPASSVFGNASYQVLGFNMVFVPEPTALALVVLGGVTLWASVRRRKREPP